MQVGLAATDEMVLRFCLARVRAWSMEYCLYSMDPAAGLVLADVVKSPGASHYATEVPKMTEGKLEAPSASVWPSFDTIEFGGPIDPNSVLESADEPPAASSARTRIRSISAAYEASPTPSCQESAAGEIAVKEPAEPTSRIGHSFQPLPSLVVDKPAPRPKTKVARLRLPLVVSQILSDLPNQWQTLAKEIETRVTRDGLRTMMVATSTPGEGATTVACALACALAEHTSLRVLLVDADFRRPSLAATLHIPSRVGIEHHLLERVSLDEIIVSCGAPKLDVLPTMEAFETRDVVVGKRLVDVLARLRSAYDLVVLDFGAVLSSGEPEALPEGIDATLVVRDPMKCGPELLDRLDAHLAQHGTCSLGVIENGVDA